MALPVLVVVVAAVLAGFGWRGRRVGDHPTCRRCGFDLFGRPQGSAACPECGADLAARRAIVTGTRARRPLMLAGGVLLVVAGGAWLGVDVYRDVKRDPQGAKPAWWLTHEVGSANAARRDAALAELVRRVEAGRLSGRRASAVTERILARQADAAYPWSTTLGDWVERARAAGKVPEEQWNRYLRQAAEQWFMRLDVRPRVRRADWFLVRLLAQPPRVGSGKGFQVVCRWDFSFDDLPPLADGWDYLLRPGPAGRGAGHVLTRPIPPQVAYQGLPAGRHKATFRATLRVYNTVGTPRASATPAAEVPVRLEQEWELLP